MERDAVTYCIAMFLIGRPWPRHVDTDNDKKTFFDALHALQHVYGYH